MRKLIELKNDNTLQDLDIDSEEDSEGDENNHDRGKHYVIKYKNIKSHKVLKEVLNN